MGNRQTGGTRSPTPDRRGLRSPDYQTAREAVDQLSKRPRAKEAALAVVLKALKAESYATRWGALNALERLAPELAAKAREEEKDFDPQEAEELQVRDVEARLNAIETRGKVLRLTLMPTRRGEQISVAELRNALDAGDEETRRYVLQYLSGNAAP